MERRGWEGRGEGWGGKGKGKGGAGGEKREGRGGSVRDCFLFI